MSRLYRHRAMYGYGAMQKAGGAGASVGGSVVDTGWINLGTFSNDASSGTTQWTAPGNAALNDGTDTSSATLSLNATSQLLKGLDLAGTPIPAGATIIGIEARVESNTTVGSALLDRASIVKGGANQAGDVSAGEELRGVSPAYTTVGGPANMWGTTLTDADVNSATFGCIIQGINKVSGVNVMLVDHVQMKIYYSI